MSNQYEALRNDVKSLIVEICVKVRNDGTTAYNWAIAQVFSETYGLARLDSKLPLPDDLKSIVRFEFNKLKEKIMTGDGWSDKTTRFAHKLVQGEIEYHRTTVSMFDNLTLEEKLKGARILLDKAGKAIANAKSSESALNARKRERAVLKEITQLEIEIEKQAAKQKANEIASAIQNAVISVPGEISVGCASV